MQPQNLAFHRSAQETLMPDCAPMSIKIDGNERDFHIKLELMTAIGTSPSRS